MQARLAMGQKWAVIDRIALDYALDQASGVAHRYWVERESANRITLGYSNPDEYGNEEPVFVRYPTFKDRRWNMQVIVVWPTNVTGGRVEYDRYSACDELDAILTETRAPVE